jgi:hypothetical protein
LAEFLRGSVRHGAAVAVDHVADDDDADIALALLGWAAGDSRRSSWRLPLMIKSGGRMRGADWAREGDAPASAGVFRADHTHPHSPEGQEWTMISGPNWPSRLIRLG